MAKGRAVAIVLDEMQKAALMALTRKHGAPQSLVVRARIVLSAARGLTNQIAAKHDVCAHTAACGATASPAMAWTGYTTSRVLARHVGSVTMRSRSARRCRPAEGRDARWSLRTMARAVVAVHDPSDLASVRPAAAATETFKLSADPLSVEKVRDLSACIYRLPSAPWFSVSTKSQVRRSIDLQPLLPMRPGQAERRTHDYIRHGTTSLFAALDVTAGTVIGKCMPRATAPRSSASSCDEVERNVPASLDVHLVMDNYSTHKTKLIRNWFAKRPRWHVHTRPLRHHGSIRSSGSSRC